MTKETYEQAKELMASIAPDVKKCYQDELDRNNVRSINACLVVGFDKKGNQEFFEFSLQRKNLYMDLLENV